MIAPATQDYLLLREVARETGLSAKVLRRMVQAGEIPRQFVVRSGEVRPVVRIHRAWLTRHAAAAPALTAIAVIPWGSA